MAVASANTEKINEQQSMVDQSTPSLRSALSVSDAASQSSSTGDPSDHYSSDHANNSSPNSSPNLQIQVPYIPSLLFCFVLLLFFFFACQFTIDLRVFCLVNWWENVREIQKFSIAEILYKLLHFIFRVITKWQSQDLATRGAKNNFDIGLNTLFQRRRATFV